MDARLGLASAYVDWVAARVGDDDPARRDVAGGVDCLAVPLCVPVAGVHSSPRLFTDVSSAS
jgi:hypothetical protein